MPPVQQLPPDPRDPNNRCIATGVSLVGRQLPNVPRHGANLLLVQAFKLGGSYAIGKAWKFSLDVDNVFDETFYSSSRAQRWVLPGNGRKVTPAGQYEF